MKLNWPKFDFKEKTINYKMSYSHPQEEFLPLDSTFRQCSVPDEMNCF